MRPDRNKLRESAIGTIGSDNNNLGVGVSVALEELPDCTKGEVAVRAVRPASGADREPFYSMGMQDVAITVTAKSIGAAAGRRSSDFSGD